jgi:hypothetical protein
VGAVEGSAVMGRVTTEETADDLVALQDAQTFLEVGSDLLDTADVRRIATRLSGIAERLKAADLGSQDAILAPLRRKLKAAQETMDRDGMDEAEMAVLLRDLLAAAGQ